jgi:cell division protein ZapA
LVKQVKRSGLVADKNRVEVRIAGKDYTLRGVESDEYIQKVAFYIDKKMNEIIKVNSKLSTQMAAVLTAVNIADDYFKAHTSEGELEREIKLDQEEISRLTAENRRLTEENNALASRNTALQLDLAKREAELSEVRNSLERKVTRRAAARISDEDEDL